MPTDEAARARGQQWRLERDLAAAENAIETARRVADAVRAGDMEQAWRLNREGHLRHAVIASQPPPVPTSVPSFHTGGVVPPTGAAVIPGLYSRLKATPAPVVDLPVLPVDEDPT